MKKMCNDLRVWIVLLATGFVMAGGLAVAAAVHDETSDEARRAGPRKLALLVGCTVYPMNDGVPELMGPANDIPMYRQLLTEPQFAYRFAPCDITVLVGWPEEEERRPTSKNIVRAFEELISQAEAGSQVVIVLSGHGVQIPLAEGAIPLDSRLSEPDGMDEVFLPADVGRWGANGLAGALRDDQIGAWLDALRQKGAHVWIIFDCCHSGSMSRDVDDVEIHRSVTPQDLGVPEALIAQVARQAAAAPEPAKRNEAAGSSDFLQLAKNHDAGGSVAAFYAAQPWEKAPELPRPRDAPRTREHYYGLFSYTINEVLRERRNPLSYRELGSLVVAKYRADRGSRGPTPCVEGDLDLEVLGVKSRPAARVTLQRQGNRLVVNCGELGGMHVGSVLSVQPLDPLQTTEKAPVAFVKVVEVSPFDATVEPCAFAGRGPLPLEDFPRRAWCRYALRDLGDMRVRVAVAPPLNLAETARPGLCELTGHIADALAELPDHIQELIDTEVVEQEAEWILRVVGAAYARQEFGIAASEPRVMLFQGGGVKLPRAAKNSQLTPDTSAFRKAYGNYSSGDIESLRGDLARDLAKIFSWQNVWRVAGVLNQQDEGRNESGLLFDVRYRQTRDAPAKPLDNAVLHPGQIVEYRFHNDGIEDLWITAAYLDGNFGIDVFLSTSLRAGARLRPLRARVTDSSTGVEGVVVFAVPMSSERPEHLAYLEQEPLGVVDRQVSKSFTSDRDTPFDRLMRTVARQAPTTRGQLLELDANPAVIAKSWVTVARR